MGHEEHDPQRAEDPGDWGYELLLQGNEEILKGSDTGTLVAFGALAYQQIQGKAEMHQNLGCALLLLSVFMCAVVHLSMGNAYVKRGKALIHRTAELRRLLLSRKMNITTTWLAVVMQFVLVVTGALLILVDKPPPFVTRLLQSVF
jgi:hypothetical protein